MEALKPRESERMCRNWEFLAVGRENNVEGMELGMANWRLPFVSPGACAHVEHVFGAMERTGGGNEGKPVSSEIWGYVSKYTESA